MENINNCCTGIWYEEIYYAAYFINMSGFYVSECLIPLYISIGLSTHNLCIVHLYSAFMSIIKKWQALLGALLCTDETQNVENSRHMLQQHGGVDDLPCSKVVVDTSSYVKVS